MLKLSLRDLFWLVLVVGMGCAWWVTNRALQTRRDAVEREYIQMYKSVHLIQSRSEPGVPPLWNLEFDTFPIGRQLVEEAGGTVPNDAAIPYP